MFWLLFVCNKPVFSKPRLLKTVGLHTCWGILGQWESVQEDEITGLCLNWKKNSSSWKNLDANLVFYTTAEISSEDRDSFCLKLVVTKHVCRAHGISVRAGLRSSSGSLQVTPPGSMVSWMLSQPLPWCSRICPSSSSQAASHLRHGRRHQRRSSSCIITLTPPTVSTWDRLGARQRWAEVPRGPATICKADRCSTMA